MVDIIEIENKLMTLLDEKVKRKGRSEFEYDDHNKKQIRTLFDYHFSPESSSLKKELGTILIGKNGTGKSVIFKSIFECKQWYLEKVKHTSRSRRFFTAKEIYNAYKQNNYPIIHAAKYAHELWIDDLGAENIEAVDYGEKVRPIIDVLDQREENEYGLTHFTTNLSTDAKEAKSLNQFYGGRTYSRIKRNSNMPIILDFER